MILVHYISDIGSIALILTLMIGSAAYMICFSRKKEKKDNMLHGYYPVGMVQQSSMSVSKRPHEISNPSPLSYHHTYLVAKLWLISMSVPLD